MQLYVYRNLKKNCFSLMWNGKVVAYDTQICLENAQFIVRQSGYQRFKEKGRKNVHAFVKGTPVDSEIIKVIEDCYTNRIVYNPRIANYFFTEEDGNPIAQAPLVYLKDNKIYI